MGVVHFAGLGRSPGAVTSGLYYLKENEGRYRDEFKGKIVESVVIFTSPEIYDGNVHASDVVNNKYMTRACESKIDEENSLKIVKEFLYKEFKDTKAYVCKVNTNDFSMCFEAVAKLLLKFHPPGKVGKHIWANITGGTNVLNLTITQVAHLSGFIPILYYTFVADLRNDGKYLKPFSQNESEFDFRRFYVLKMKFDERSLYIYDELDGYKGWIKDSELLNRLKGKRPELFQDMDLETFRRDFLNVIHGIGCQDNSNRLTEAGKELLNILRSPLVEVLTRLKEPTQSKIEELYKDLNLEEIL
jgi:hypothetical protein